MEEDCGNFEVVLDEEKENENYYVSNIRDLKRYIEDSKSKNTQKKIKSVVHKFETFVKSEGVPEGEILQLEPANLDTLIGKWLLNDRKKDGQEYEPDTLNSNFRALDKYLNDNGYGRSLVTDEAFKTSRDILAAKRKHLKGIGLGNKKNKSEPLSVEDEEQMWEKGGLGDNDPDVLQRTVWYLLTKNLGFRGCHEARQLCFGDLEEKVDENTHTYYEWTEKFSKTRQGGSSCRPFNPKIFRDVMKPERCPVKLIQEFISHRPEMMCQEDSPFFIQVNRGRSPGEKIWYKCQALGINSLSTFMKGIAVVSGISSHRKITNHSVRKTSCSRLLHAGVPPTAVAQLSGHKNVASLNHYNVLNFRQQQLMSNVLASTENNSMLPGSRRLSGNNTEKGPAICLPFLSSSSDDTSDSKPNDRKRAFSEAPVFHINNSGSGSIQFIYGAQPNLHKISNNEELRSSQQVAIENRANSPKRFRRILPLMYSDSESD